MTLCVGGAISADSLPFLRRLSDGVMIDRYETRKICFSCPDALKDGAEKGIAKAVEFELLWLQNKRSYYKTIAEEDEKRIIMLEARHKQSQTDRREEGRMERADERRWLREDRGALVYAIAKRLKAEGIEVITPASAEMDLLSDASIDAYLMSLVTACRYPHQ